MQFRVIKKHFCLAALLAMLASLTFVSCSDDTISAGDYDDPIKLTGVRYASPDSSQDITRIAPGDVVALVGENMNSVVNVYFNGFQASFNPALAKETHLVVTVPADIPYGSIDPDGEEINTIRVTNNGHEDTMDFEILPPGPVVNSISNEFAGPGDIITLTGNYLYLVTEVSFPGGVISNEFEASDDGTWMNVTVPDGVGANGHVTVKTIAGTSPATVNTMFRYESSVFINFDDKNPFTPWTQGIRYVTTADVDPVDGNYLRWYQRNIPVPMWWSDTLAAPFQGGINWPDIDSGTDLTNLALKFEVNVPIGIQSGNIKVNFGLSDDQDEYFWDLWTVENSDGTVDRNTLQTDGWETLTFELQNFNSLDVYTYGDLIHYEDGSPRTFGLFYLNPSDGLPHDEIEMYFDNFRIVEMN